MCGSSTHYRDWKTSSSAADDYWRQVGITLHDFFRLNSWTGVHIFWFEPSHHWPGSVYIKHTSDLYNLHNSLNTTPWRSRRNTHALIQSSADWSLHPAAPVVLSLVPHQIWVSTWETRTASSPTQLGLACRPLSPGRSASARWCWSGVWPSQLGMPYPTVVGQPHCQDQAIGRREGNNGHAMLACISNEMHKKHWQCSQSLQAWLNCILCNSVHFRVDKQWASFTATCKNN